MQAEAIPGSLADALTGGAGDAKIAQEFAQPDRTKGLALMVTTPRAVSQFIQMLQEAGGEDSLRIVMLGEEATDVVEQLEGGGEIVACVNRKDAVQGQA